MEEELDMKADGLLAACAKAVERNYPSLEQKLPIPELLKAIIVETRLARKKDPEGFALIKNLFTGALEDEHQQKLQGNKARAVKSVVNAVSEELSQKLYHDPLTGAYNRHYLNEHYGDNLSDVAMVMLDLDYLKDINDRFGHKAGDLALVSVACTIQKFVRKRDHLIRYGGDEFLLIIEDVDQMLLGTRLKSISDAVRQLTFEAYPDLKLSISIGGVFGSGTKAELLEHADKLLYRGKVNRGSVYVSALDGSRVESFIATEQNNHNTANSAYSGALQGLKRTVLVIEDNEINREVLAELLSDDYEVLQAENGKVGLELLHEHLKDVSVIILDVQMPVMNGYEFLEVVKSSPILSEVPVIVATGNNYQEEEQKCLALGAVDFVTKPYNTDIIKSRIAGIIRLKESATTMSALQTDDLTGIYTLQAFCYYAKQTMDQYPNKDYSLAIIDVNQFRLINESLGEAEGDQVLRIIAKTIKAYVTSDCIYGRYGAARFVILHETLSPEDMELRINSLFAKLQRACDVKNITFKAGVYNNIDRELSMAAVCDRAIVAMNSVNQSFEGNYAVYDEEHAAHERRLAAMEADMREAYEKGQFSVYYQPKHDTYTGKLVGAEALVRWIHPKLGFMSPADFIPLFEKNGFISYVDYYVWNRTCQNLRSWQDEGLIPVPISVNASRKDFDQDNFIDVILGPVHVNSINPELLHIEVTESLFSDKIEQMSQLMQECRDAGFKIELDDFGTGYSSLTTLASLPLDVLKLDMSFMRNYQDEKKLKVLAASINLAKSLGLKTVSEGVENKEQVELLQKYGSDYIQGYYFSKPLTETEFREYLIAHS